jgi:hypothetical protein
MSKVPATEPMRKIAMALAGVPEDAQKPRSFECDVKRAWSRVTLSNGCIPVK